MLVHGGFSRKGEIIVTIAAILLLPIWGPIVAIHWVYKKIRGR